MNRYKTIALVKKTPRIAIQRGKFRRIMAISLALAIITLMLPFPALADTPNPDSTPTVEEINIYRNCRETGDWLVLVFANVPYITPPSTPFTDTFIWRFMDTDNTTQLGATVGNNFNQDGYGYNLSSFYFNAANVTALGLVWGTSYIVRLSGNPSVFDTPPEYNYNVVAGDYSTSTTMAETQAELAARILAVVSTLENRWGLDPNDLVIQSEAGTYLSTIGESFIRQAIYGVQAMAPDAFMASIRSLDVDYRIWDETYSGNLTDQWDGTWIQTARVASQALFGTSYDLLSIILTVVIMFALVFGTVWLGAVHWIGWLDASAWGIAAARLGLYPFGFLLLGGFIALVYVSSRIWFRVFR